MIYHRSTESYDLDRPRGTLHRPDPGRRRIPAERRHLARRRPRWPTPSTHVSISCENLTRPAPRGWPLCVGQSDDPALVAPPPLGGLLCRAPLVPEEGVRVSFALSSFRFPFLLFTFLSTGLASGGLQCLCDLGACSWQIEYRQPEFSRLAQLHGVCAGLGSSDEADRASQSLRDSATVVVYECGEFLCFGTVAVHTNTPTLQELRGGLCRLLVRDRGEPPARSPIRFRTCDRLTTQQRYLRLIHRISSPLA